MATLQLSAISKEYLKFPGIQAFDATSPDHAVNPTTLTIQAAFVAPGVDPGSSDWHAAEWVDPTTARILTGAGGVITPAPGRYLIWLRVLGAVEQPAHQVATIEVT